MKKSLLFSNLFIVFDQLSFPLFSQLFLQNTQLALYK